MDILFVLTHQFVQDIKPQYWQGFIALDTYLTLIETGSTFMGSNLEILQRMLENNYSLTLLFNSIIEV